MSQKIASSKVVHPTTSRQQRQQRQQHHIYRKMTQQMTAFYVGLFPFTAFFWVWALINTIGMDAGSWDWGVASFATVLVTTSYVLGTRSAGSIPHGAPRLLVTFSHVLVSLNYIFGSYIGFAVLHNTGFGAYCVIFALLWLGIAWYGRELIVKSESSIL